MSSAEYTLDWLDRQMPAPPTTERDRDILAKYDESLRQVARVLEELGRACSLELAKAVLMDDRRVGGVERMSYAMFAAATALLARQVGVDMLARVAVDGSYASSAQTAIHALWMAGSGKRVPSDGYESNVVGFNIAVDDTTREAARVALDELIVASKDDPSLFAKIMILASNEANKNQIMGEPNEFSEHVMRVFSAGSISVPGSVLDDFARLIEQDLPEERYQEFLKANPTVLDPLAAEVIAKKRLGEDYVTDFVVRRHDQRYLVVEIEKPQDPIFTQADDFSKHFSHAMGQVLDFQGWVAEQAGYAQKKLPGIESPRGLLVIGRRETLTASQANKLRRWNVNSNMIDVVTYDDLITSGRRLLRSLQIYLDNESSR